MSEQARVLIVDDDAEVRESVARILLNGGFACDRAADGQAGLELLLEKNFEVALLDIEMPKLNGLELVNAIRQRGIPVVPVILSCNSKIPNVVEAMRLGAFDFLEKPANPQAIEGAVARAAAHAALARRAREMTGLAEKWEVAYREVSDRRRLQEAALGIIEEEQRRLGQDLHDGLVQQISGASYLVEALQNRLEASAPEEAATTKRIQELLRQTVAQARNLARGLCPVGLETTDHCSTIRKSSMAFPVA
jgi:FixJ family two-component response regulator